MAFLVSALWNPCPVLVPIRWGHTGACLHGSEEVGEGLEAHFCEEQLEELGLLSLEV